MVDKFNCITLLRMYVLKICCMGISFLFRRYSIYLNNIQSLLQIDQVPWPMESIQKSWKWIIAWKESLIYFYRRGGALDHLVTVD